MIFFSRFELKDFFQMRYTHRDMPRMFQVPFGTWFLPISGSLLCILLLVNTSQPTAFRFLVWTGIGQIIYFSYGFRHSKGRLSSRKQSVNSISNVSFSMRDVAINVIESKSQNNSVNEINDAVLEEITVQYF